MPSAAAASNARIPAWKRLGLKLKSAQETPDTALPTAKPVEEIESPKRKRTADTQDGTPVKKVKKAKNSSGTPAAIAASHTPTDSTTTLLRKKSVTFTPETKEEDGDSIKQLFNAWVAEQKAQDPSFGTKTTSPAFDTPEPPKVEQQVDSTLDERERRVKRVKKLKSEKLDKSENSPKPKTVKPKQVGKATNAPTRPFLAYLKQYHESRETWKFNKNHQDRILKHIFDVNIIPSEYSHHIYDYVRGLQGAVRTRLRDSAFAVKVKDQEEGVAGFPDNMTDPAARQKEYDVAMKEYVATMMANGAHSKMGYEEGVLLGLSDAAMGKRVAKRMRSEQILRELGTPQEQKDAVSNGKEVAEERQKRLRMNDGTVQKLGRKRKQRTMAVESDTSSSEDSSHSGSDDSSSDESAPAVRRDQSQSSSSSSSSSSGSEVESDNEDSSEEDSETSDSD